MRVVTVDHPKLTAEVLHLSEMPLEVVQGLQPDNYGLLDTCIRVFELGILEPEKVEAFQELKISEMLQFWSIYQAAEPYEKELFTA
jgi:hypothetical protein